MSGMQEEYAFAAQFRRAAPYIRNLSGKTVVVAVSSRVLANDAFPALAADLRILAGLGIRLVILHGTRYWLNHASSAAANPAPVYHRDLRVTDAATLDRVKQACGQMRSDLEAALSAQPAHMAGAENKALHIASGNYLLAKPLGVIDGVDMGFTGVVRRVDTAGVNAALDAGAVVVVSPLGYSLSGKAFNLGKDDVAQALAVSLKAEKLIFLGAEPGIADASGRPVSLLTSDEAQQLISDGHQPEDTVRMLRAAVYGLEHGVRRVQMVSGLEDGSLLKELFTRQGCGTSLALAPFMRIRPADNRDIGDILGLTAPLEAAGVLLSRDQTYLENHIGEFYLLEHDCNVYGCVALRVFPGGEDAELACLVVSPEVRAGGYGGLLLDYVVEQARQKGIHRLFALSTQTGEWFDERGFTPVTPDMLPAGRQDEYRQSRRNSKIYSMDLSQHRRQ